MFKNVAFHQILSVCLAGALGVALLVSFSLQTGDVPPSCTTLLVSSGETVLFGNNEDVSMQESLVGFYPATSSRYGMVKVGYQRTEGERSLTSYQGGMNDQGLAWDSLGIPKASLNPHYERDLAFWEDEFLGNILPYYSSVSQVVELVDRYDFGDSMSMQIYVADASGDAVVIGPGADGEVGFTRKKVGNGYLLAVNHNPLIPDQKIGFWDNSADRLVLAETMLDQMSGNGRVKYGEIANVLDAVHLQGIVHGFFGRLTSYSNIFDLRERAVYLYYQGQYGEVVKFDLAQELAKGEHIIRLDELLSPETLSQAEASFLRYQPLSRQLTTIVGILVMMILCLLVYGTYWWLRRRQG
ncbi:hypothetical protein ACFLZW_04480 [Chloroflexota bacterium]